MKKHGFGAIDLLISLLVMSALFLIYARMIKGVVPIKTENNIESIEKQVDETVNEIESLKNQRIELENKMLENNF